MISYDSTKALIKYSNQNHRDYFSKVKQNPKSTYFSNILLLKACKNRHQASPSYPATLRSWLKIYILVSLKLSWHELRTLASNL